MYKLTLASSEGLCPMLLDMEIVKQEKELHNAAF